MVVGMGVAPVIIGRKGEDSQKAAHPVVEFIGLRESAFGQPVLTSRTYCRVTLFGELRPW
jgi:hypothetical protein